MLYCVSHLDAAVLSLSILMSKRLTVHWNYWCDDECLFNLYGGMCQQDMGEEMKCPVSTFYVVGSHDIIEKNIGLCLVSEKCS